MFLKRPCVNMQTLTCCNTETFNLWTVFVRVELSIMMCTCKGSPCWYVSCNRDIELSLSTSERNEFSCPILVKLSLEDKNTLSSMAWIWSFPEERTKCFVMLIVGRLHGFLIMSSAYWTVRSPMRTKFRLWGLSSFLSAGNRASQWCEWKSTLNYSVSI